MTGEADAREVPAAELAKAEDSLRHQSERDRESLVIDRDELRVLLAEYDRRGGELERLRPHVATIARHWDGVIRDTSDDNPVWTALDALAREHEDGEKDR